MFWRAELAASNAAVTGVTMDQGGELQSHGGLGGPVRD